MQRTEIGADISSMRDYSFALKKEQFPHFLNTHELDGLILVIISSFNLSYKPLLLELYAYFEIKN
jgi:hypothetical protein